MEDSQESQKDVESLAKEKEINNECSTMVDKKSNEDLGEKIDVKPDSLLPPPSVTIGSSLATPKSVQSMTKVNKLRDTAIKDSASGSATGELFLIFFFFFCNK